MPVLPSRRFAALVAVAGGAFLVSTSFALALDALLLVLLIVEGIALYRLNAPRIVRTAPAFLPLGGEGEVEVEFREVNGSALHIEWTDDRDRGVERVGPDILAVTLPPSGVVVQKYVLRGIERGRYRLGDLHLRVRGPRGLLWRRLREHQAAEILVQPGLPELRRQRLVALRSRWELGRRPVRQVGEGREFERLREYARGDDPRRIDWKATARRGQPIVREFSAERSQSIVLAIDTGRLMAERFDERDRLDYALAAALVLADAAAVHGDAVGVMLFADTVQSFIPPGRVPLARLAETLTTAHPRSVEPDYPAAFQYLGRQLRRRSLVVVFTDVIDARSSAALLAHLAVGARRHLPLIVAIRNPGLEAAARMKVASTDGAYRRAAAEELLQARAIALAGLRRQGVLVADVRPGDVVGETLARYLEVKQRALL